MIAPHSSTLAVLLLTLSASAAAQVTTDASLGPAGAVPEDGANFLITEDLGRSMGSNLFHSFDRFDIPVSRVALFSSFNSFENVIARITGGGSSIDGTLRSSVLRANGAGAALYLINPGGITFGSTAVVDVPGSLHLSSAHVLRFVDGEFDSRSTLRNPVLSAQAPTAFGFLDGSAGRISFERGFSLSVPRGETLSIVGGDVSIQGSFSPVIVAPDARVQIASASSEIDVPLQLETLDLSSRETGDLGTVRMEFGAELRLNSSSADVPAGTVVIRSGQFVMLDAKISAVHRAPADAAPTAIDIDVVDSIDLMGDASTGIATTATGSGRGPGIRIRADTVSLSGSVVGGPLVRTGTVGTGAGGDVSIEARTLTLSDGAVIQSLNRGPGLGGTLDFGVRDLVVSNRSEILSEATGEGPGADLSFSTSSLSIIDGGSVRSVTGGNGNGGSVSIVANAVLVSGRDTAPSRLKTQVAANGLGAGGLLSVATGTLRVENGAEVSTETNGAGRAGNLRIAREFDEGGGASRRAELVRVSGGPLGPSIINSASSPPDAGALAGDGGQLLIASDQVRLLDGGVVSSSTRGRGNAGSLTIEAGTVLIDGVDPALGETPSGVFAQALGANTGAGNGGDVLIEADAVEIGPDGRVSAETRGPGNAGTVTVSATLLTIDGGEISALARGDGAVGGVEIRNAEDVVLLGGARVLAESASVFGAQLPDPGRAGGSILITDVDRLHLVDGSVISTRTGDLRDGGRIDIRTNAGVWLSGGSEITAESTSPGDAGDISIDAGRTFESRQSFVRTNANDPDADPDDDPFGGNIEIIADELVYLEDSEVTTSVGSGDGRGGDISIDPRFVVLNRSLVQANAGRGDAGNIAIQSGRFFQSLDSRVEATNELGIQGEINVSSPDTDLIGQLASLPADYTDAASLLTNQCAARTAPAGSFVVLGRDAIPAPPDAPLQSFYLGRGALLPGVTCSRKMAGQ